MRFNISVIPARPGIQSRLDRGIQKKELDFPMSRRPVKPENDALEQSSL